MKAAPSRLQVKVAPVGVEEKLKLAEVLDTVPVGPDMMEVSGDVLSTVTVILAVVVVRLDVSAARAAIVTEPSGTEVEFQLMLYGEVVSVPTTEPLTRKDTEATATLSLAFAERVTVPRTFAPFAGAVSVTLGGVTSRTPVVKLQV